MADDDGKKGGDEKVDVTKDPAFQQLAKMVKGLGVLVAQQNTASNKTQESLNSLVEKIDSGGLGGPKKVEDEVDENAINDLDNKDFLQIVLSEVGKVITDKVGVVDEKVGKVDDKLTSADIQKQIVDLNAKDFLDWRSEISNLAKAHTSLGVEDLYHMARRQNPDKTTELDAKYSEKKADDDKGFLSLMPGGGGTEAEDDEKLTDDEARNKAWDETVDKFPGLANLGEG